MVKTIPLRTLAVYLFEDAPSMACLRKRFGEQVSVTAKNMASLADYVAWEGCASVLLDHAGWEQFVTARDKAVLEYIDSITGIDADDDWKTQARLEKEAIHKRNVKCAKAFAEIYNRMKEVRNNELANHA